MTTRWWVYDGQVVGPSAGEMSTPANFLEVDGAEAEDREEVYFDSTTQRVLLKPAQPSATHFWNIELQSWMSYAELQPEPEPETLEAAIAQAKQDCLQYWGDRIRACTAGYPATEVSTWIDFKRECEYLISFQDLSQATNIYQEIMLRQFGIIATPQYCQQYQQDHPEEALAMALAFAQGILQKNAYLLPELTRLKGMRGYHWEQIEALETIEAVRGYDFRTT